MISALIIGATLTTNDVSQGAIEICRRSSFHVGNNGPVLIPAGVEFTEPAAVRGELPNHAFIVETDAAASLPVSPGCVVVKAHMKTGTIGYVVGPNYPLPMRSTFGGAGAPLEAKALSPMQVFVIVP